MQNVALFVAIPRAFPLSLLLTFTREFQIVYPKMYTAQYMFHKALRCLMFGAFAEIYLEKCIKTLNLSPATVS